MAGSKVLFACILIVIVISSQAEARQLMAATGESKEPCNDGAVAVKGDGGGLRVTQAMATETSTGKGGEEMPMTTTDSRPTAPGNSPGIGNKGKINN
uniref:Uncharacterized protein n=1 Tax=Arundo donax TaxID=35708 RepID=A0A0A9BMW5_ARUDO